MWKQQILNEIFVSENCLLDQDISNQSLIKHLDMVLSNADEIGRKQWEQSRYLGNKVRDDFSEMLHFFG